MEESDDHESPGNQWIVGALTSVGQPLPVSAKEHPKKPEQMKMMNAGGSRQKPCRLSTRGPATVPAIGM